MPSKKCLWCGKSFEIKSPNQKYCCKEHKIEGYREKDRKRQCSYYKRFSWKIKARVLGTGGLGSTPKEDFRAEFEQVRKEMRRFKLIGVSLGMGFVLNDHSYFLSPSTPGTFDYNAYLLGISAFILTILLLNLFHRDVNLLDYI